MEWSDLRDKFEPLNQHVSLPANRKQEIRARLHAEIDELTAGLTKESQVTHIRRRRRAVTAGSLSAAMVAVLCIAAVIDYSTHHPGAQGGPVAAGPNHSASKFSSESSASSSSTASSSGSTAAGPAEGLSSANSSGGGIMNSAVAGMQPLSPAVQLTADNPLQMYGNNGWMWTGSALMRTTDAGTKWQKVAFPLTGRPVSETVSVVNGASVRVAVGLVSNNHASIDILRSEDGGSTWQTTKLAENLPGQSSGQLPASMTFSGEKDGWMTTNVPLFAMGGTAPGALYRTTDGAESWQRVQPKGFPKGVVPFPWLTFISPQVGFTAAAPQANADAGVTNGQYKLYRTTDGGLTWSTANIALPKGSRVNILAPQFNGPVGYLPVVVQANKNSSSSELVLFKSTDSGTTWKQVYGFAGSAKPGAAMSVNQQSVWVYWDGTLWSSTNSGAVFTAGKSVPGAVTELDMTGAEAGYAVVAKAVSGTANQVHVLYKTTDGGATWTRVSPQP